MYVCYSDIKHRWKLEITNITKLLKKYTIYYNKKECKILNKEV